MPVQGRALSLATLGLLLVLSAGAGVWSALTGPRDADVQLHDAASNTAAASSFVATLDSTIKESLIGSSVAGGSSGVQSETSKTTETVDYQAPDRVKVKETTQTSPSTADGTGVIDLVQIGTSCWETPADPSEPSDCQASAIPMFLDLVSGLEKSSKVTLHSGTYKLDSSDSKHFILTDFLDGSGGVTALSKASVQIRIDGSNVVWEHLSFATTEPSGGTSANGQPEMISVSLDIVARFTQIGSAPPVVRPTGAPTSKG
jgi:hypothetical protein